MKVEIRISPDAAEPYAVIHTAKRTEEIEKLAAALENAPGEILTAMENGRIIVLRPEEIYMVRAENEKTLLCCESRQFPCRKRLYELEEALGRGFMRISKSALINLRYLDSVEPTFSGMMELVLKNGCRDYVSRKYLPGLKKYLGL